MPKHPRTLKIKTLSRFPKFLRKETTTFIQKNITYILLNTTFDSSADIKYNDDIYFKAKYEQTMQINWLEKIHRLF